MHTDLAAALRAATPLALCLTMTALASAQVTPELRQRAERGDPEAQFTLGYMYVTGDDAPLDLAEAATWFRRAAEQGEPGGQFNLGLMYAYGDGVARDMDAAVRWLVLAAEQGRIDAQYTLGVTYDRR